MASTDLLPMTGGAMNVSAVCDACSPRLMEILAKASSADEAAQLILRDELLVSECRRIQPLVARLAKPVPRAEIKIALQPLLLMFDPPSFGRGREAEALEGAWEDVYLKALAGLPREALAHAIDEWTRIGKSFPKPAHLRELAQPVAEKVALIAWRVRKAVERAQAQWRDKPAQTPEERQEMRDRLKGLMAELGASRAFPQAQRAS